MIALVGVEDRRRFGIETALRIGGVPYRIYPPSAAIAESVVVLTADDAPSRVGAFAGRARVVVMGQGPSRAGTITTSGSIALTGAIWPQRVRGMAGQLGLDAALLPRVQVAEEVPAGRGSEVLATLRDGAAAEHPAVIEQAGVVWCPADIGSAFTDLLDEGYLPQDEAPDAWRIPRALLGLYYRLPELVRRVVQRRMYRRLANALDRTQGASSYPVDGSGWLLLELLLAVVRRTAGGLVRVATWPGGFRAAATVTHDVEPTAYAYGPGLARLLDSVEAIGHPATVGLVAEPARRGLDRETVERLGAVDVLCHGLEHRGETLIGAREDVRACLARARATLAEHLGRRIDGFRSPRLDRNRSLLWALDQEGFRFDSSFPDVDRENLTRFGAGVRLCVPYRPPIADEGDRVRPSACLELPVSAPDCIQPLFAGDDVGALRAAVRAKVEFIRATGGLFVGIVHGGVFGPGDSARRDAHLRFVLGMVRVPDVWLARPAEIVAWWTARERLEVVPGSTNVEVTNHGDRPLAEVQLVIEGEGDDQIVALPVLAAGARVSIALTRAIRAGGVPR